METAQNNFKDIILEEVGEIPISSTQKLWVLIVLCSDTGKVMISAQKWWRPNRDAAWIAGKGHKLDLAKGRKYGELINKACERLEDRL